MQDDTNFFITTTSNNSKSIIKEIITFIIKNLFDKIDDKNFKEKNIDHINKDILEKIFLMQDLNINIKCLLNFEIRNNGIENYTNEQEPVFLKENHG